MKSPRITPEEVGIIKRAQAGDESAFNTLFYRYKGFVENLLFRYLKDMEEAKDVANIVFLKVYDKLSMFTAYESFGGWLRILTNHTAIDYLRETKNKALLLGDEDGRLPSEKSSSSAESDLINRITYEQILAEFDKFPDVICKILKLFYVNNMTVDQISEVLNVPTGTIKSTLSRTRRKVKKLLNV